jgi:S1-C subfamily serine protease
VKLPSGEKTTVAVVGRDSATDLALLKVPGAPGHVVIADEAHTRVGEIVLSIGRRKEEGLAATYGVISAIGGPWRTWQGARIDRWLRLDLNPFPGFSGGPVVNAQGEALGMATSGPRQSAVTIPASTVSRVVDQLLLKGRMVRCYLGVRVQPVAFPEEAAKEAGIAADHGLMVVMVEPKGPASNAGVLLGDILVSIAGAELHDAHSLQSALDAENIGKPVKVDLVRGGQLLHLNVVVGETPER